MNDYIFRRMQCESTTPEKIPVEQKYVSDGLKNLKSPPKWVGLDPGKRPITVINAPTGSGKSTFVLEDLRKIAKDKNQSILLLTNRNILNLQQKIIASRTTSKQKFGTVAIKPENHFDNIWLFTYQSILGYLEKHKLNNIGFVVFDEAHFFLSDSAFNSETDVIWFQLLYMFPNAQRIYMSATTQDLYELIDIVESRISRRIFNISHYVKCIPRSQKDELEILNYALNHSPVSGVVEYNFHESFSNINLYFYNSIEYLRQMIDADDENKWLIFVSNKEDGNELKKLLKGTKVEYIDADTKLKKEALVSDMARREKFSSKVLICTSVLDCGVNFKDEKLKNIVIDSAIEVQIKQMLGRKRREENETVNLYVKCKTQDDISKLNDAACYDYNVLWRISENAAEYYRSNWGEMEPRIQRLLRPPVQQDYHHTNTARYSVHDGIQYERIDYNNDDNSDNRAVYYVYEYGSNFYTLDSNIFSSNKTYNPPFIRYDYSDRFSIYENDEFYNIILPYYLGIITGKYEHLLDRFADEGETAFMREVCEWLGITFSEDMVVDRDFLKKKKSKEKEEVKESIKNCLGEYLDKELDKTEVIELRDDLRGILQDNNLTGGQGKEEEGKLYLKGDSKNAMGDINKILRYFEISYILKGRNPTYWFEKEND